MRRCEQTHRSAESPPAVLPDRGPAPALRGRTAYRSARGWTLIELLVVMSLIVLLAGIGLVTYQNSIRRSQEAVLKEDLFRLRDAIDQYYADKNKYPASLDALVSEGYLRAVPKDPFTQGTDWTTMPAEPDASNPTAEPGIFDIHSASEGTALDGTRYNEW